MTGSSFTDTLRVEARPSWDLAMAHRFCREVADDTISDSHFARYLRIEYGFLDSAAVALGYTVVKAPDFVTRRHLATALYGLTTDQEAYFRDAFATMGIDPDDQKGGTATGQRLRLHELTAATARDAGFAEILTVMLGAEWFYQSWCTQAAATPSRRPVIRRWVELHAGGPFITHVDWLRCELDRLVGAQDPSGRERHRDLFAAVLDAECDFHDRVYASAEAHPQDPTRKEAT